MSTRSQIIIKNSSHGDEQWFYRHSDGYPEGNLPELFKFMTWVKEGRIRNNVEQSAGWLILIGADEYGYNYDFKNNTKTRKKNLFEPDKEDRISGWKCGAYEICTCGQKHGDIEWLYTIDLHDNTLIIHKEYNGKTVVMDYDELKKYEKNWQKLEGECF